MVQEVGASVHTSTSGLEGAVAAPAQVGLAEGSLGTSQVRARAWPMPAGLAGSPDTLRLGQRQPAGARVVAQWREVRLLLVPLT